MGYDLHITRRKFWADKGEDITVEQWLECVRRDSELRFKPENGPHFAEWSGGSGASWLDWSDGRIYAKNPEAALIDKMVSIARQFNATVQGDDGEIYQSGTELPRHPKPSFGERLAGWLAWALRRRPPKIEHPPLGFGVGDKVRDTFGNEHTVIAIDPRAEHGLGVIRTRRISDGSEHAHAMIAHGFEPLDGR